VNRVKDKVAIVTGAAAGIGRTTALLLAKEGARVIVSDIDEEGGQQTVTAILRASSEALFIKHDVTSESDWARVIHETLSKYKKLDVLVNNAGIGIMQTIENTSLADWRRLMSVNLESVFLGTKYAVKTMKKSGGGSIINISSAAGIIGILESALYCASKGAVRLFTKAAAIEFSKAGLDYNIRVNSVHPGIIETPLKKALETRFKDSDINPLSGKDVPIGSAGEPIDIAYAVLYLASDESKYATGSEFVIDGGQTAS
jgi:3(or 17)beta-hydroxysteroid dehydrogenase